MSSVCVCVAGITSESPLRKDIFEWAQLNHSFSFCPVNVAGLT